MNISRAKQQIKNAMTAYFTKDEYGRYAIPVERQRPVFLMGPPGIGKTAIMEQIAQELGVALVSYSMTHHTRQSAIGLPFIAKKTYRGREYDVSEYTMSEIIASVYELEEATGLRQGILFLDEINCVSETLAPMMLQFLQYKVFGRHRVPDGWIVVTAGNPPEYNNSVREFDVVTWDRLKRINVEPDYTVWKEYAQANGVHPAVLAYLDLKGDNFYKIETSVDGKSFVTARGWVDLSDMLLLYEQQSITVDADLVSQYLQNVKIARDFSTYYDLFNKYRSDYQVDDILGGKASAEIKERARAAKFDERLALLRLILDRVSGDARAIIGREGAAKVMIGAVANFRAAAAAADANPIDALNGAVDDLVGTRRKQEKASGISGEAVLAAQIAETALTAFGKKLVNGEARTGDAAFKLIKSEYEKYMTQTRKDAVATTEKLNNAFAFCDDVFGDGQETLILVTELTADKHTASLISRYGCEGYFRHNKDLLFHERQKEIILSIETLDSGELDLGGEG